MDITQAQKEDLPEIISLMKQSLGEGLLPKSEAFFLWKHHRNPFGESKILLAREDGKIVGLRAFMRWKWVNDVDCIDAVRAVDTATDPAFQGRGIFKKLTLQAADECCREGVSLVFNTPNPISMQGYLKMGWHVAGKMPIYIGPGSLVPKLYSESFTTKAYDTFDVGKALDSLVSGWKLAHSGMEFHTPISTSYLQWRYRDCPMVRYGALIESGAFGIVFRLKKVNHFTELRICEIWTENEKQDEVLKKALKKITHFCRPAIITCAESPSLLSNKRRISGLFGPFKKGPVTTLKPLAMQKLDNFDLFSHWKPSLGSMELF